MFFRQMLPVIVVLAVGLAFAIDGDATLKFIATWIIAPAIVLLIGGLAVALFVAFLTPPPRR